MPRKRRRRNARHLTYGRNTLLTDVVQGVILDAHSKGMSLYQAATLVGLKPRTVLGWYRKGRDTGREPYFTFYREADAAWAAGSMANLNRLNLHADDDPNTAWKLQGVYDPENFGPNRKLEQEPAVALPPGPQQNVQVVILRPEEIIAYEDRMLIAERGLSEEEDADAERALDRLVTDPDAE